MGGGEVGMRIRASLLERFAMGEALNDPLWKFIDDDIVGEWRRGTVHQVVVQNTADGHLYGFEFKEQGNDHYWTSFEDFGDDDLVELYRVKAVMTLTYQRAAEEPTALVPDTA